MPQRWCCPQGHQWESSTAGPSAATGCLLACPVCGSGNVSAVQENGAPSDTLLTESPRTPGSTQGKKSPATVPTPPRAGHSDSATALDETLPPPNQRPTGVPGRLTSPVPPASREPAIDVTLPRPLQAPSTGKTSPLSGSDCDQTLERSGPSQGKVTGHAENLADEETLKRSEMSDTGGLQGPGAANGERQSAGIGYEILGELGRGGMGVVYKARQVALNRLTALKMILAGAHAGKEDLNRFQIEARAVAQLRHPNIVQIYEVGERDGHPFFSLEYVDGGSLQGKLDGTPMPPRQAAQLVQTLAQAMHYAHQQGIVHRDLKPANVLLMADGTPKITDFGLAKQLRDDSGQTGSGAILGTPSYMAPEQAEGKTATIGPAADIYSLGALFYDLLTGRPPFRGQTIMDTLQQVINAEPVAPRELQPRVPLDLETICLKCLRKEPNKRYASAEVLADDVRRFLAGEPIQARPVSFSERAWKWARRHPAVAVLLATLTLVLVGGFLGMTALWLHAEQQRIRADELKTEAQAASAKATEAAKVAVAAREQAQNNYERARRIAYATHMSLAQTALKDGHRERTLEVLEELKQRRTGEQDLRGFEWYYLWRLARSERLGLKGHTSLVTQVAFSPDGKHLATASLDQTVKIWDTATGQELRTLKGHRRPVRGVAFSPDGKHLASAGADGLVLVWDADTGRRLFTLEGHNYAVSGVVFSPDGKSLASGGEDQTVRVWDLETGRPTLTLKGHRYGVTGVAFRPDGKRLASASEDQTVKVWDAVTGAAIETLKGHTHWVSCVAFSADGKRLASGGWDQTVRVWDLTDGKAPVVLKGQSRPVRSVAFGPEGRYLASASADGTLKVWDLANDMEPRTLEGQPGLVRTVAFSTDGQLLASVGFDVQAWEGSLVYTGHSSSVQAVAFSTDGTAVASGSGLLDPDKGDVRGEVKVWSLSSRADLLTFTTHTGLVRSVSFSRDGKYLASGSEDQTVRLVELATGKQVQVLTGHQRRVTCVRFNPGSTCLASCGEDGTIKVWDVQTGREAASLTGHSGPVRAVAFSTDGKRLASAGADRTIKVWDLAAGRALHTLKGHAFGVTSVAFSPDGKHLVSGSEDQTLKIWDAVVGTNLLTLAGHTDGVTGVAFSPDGKRLASASEDHTVKIWDAFTGQETLTLQGHSDGVTGVAFSPDGRQLVTAGRDQTVRIWEAPLED